MSATNQAAVTTSASLVAAGDANAPTSIVLRNRGTASVFWGYASTVSLTTGVELGVGEWLAVPCDSGDKIYAIAASGSQRVDWARSRDLVRRS